MMGRLKKACLDGSSIIADEVPLLEAVAGLSHPETRLEVLFTAS
jgi:hypothetical protein